MEPKFRMGLGKLREPSRETEQLNQRDMFANEEAIAFDFFDNRKDALLFVGAGYVWRSVPASHALEMVHKDLRDSLIVSSEEKTLQNIASFAAREFDILKSHGIRFHGRFIVHDVQKSNGTMQTRLVIAVPHVKDEKENIRSDAEKQAYANEYLSLQKNLLAYFDSRASQNLPLLWDTSKFVQYVYGRDDADGKQTFVLVDPDPHIGATAIEYENFLHGHGGSGYLIHDEWYSSLPAATQQALQQVDVEYRKRRIHNESRK
jgi:hypothetical protein